MVVVFVALPAVTVVVVVVYKSLFNVPSFSVSLEASN